MNEKMQTEVVQALENFKPTARDKEKFDELSIELMQSIEDNGLSHYYTAQAVDKLTRESDCKRGIFHQLLLIKNPDIIDVDNANTYVSRTSAKRVMTLEDFKSNEDHFKDKVECFAPMDQFYHRSRSKKEGWLIQEMLRTQVEDGKEYTTEVEILKMIEEKPDWYMLSKSFPEYTYGNYITYGWLVTCDTVENEKRYVVHTPNWDGLKVPEGKTSYEEWKKK